MNHDENAFRPRRQPEEAKDDRIYSTTCPHCGAEVYYKLEVKDEKRLYCLSCGKQLPNPHYDPSDPRRRRRLLSQGLAIALVIAVFAAAAWFLLRYTFPV